MTYEQFINNIIKLRGQHNCSGYYEKHHIVPKCVSRWNGDEPDNTSSNIIHLTAQEHFIAHKLLSEQYGHIINGLNKAYWRMVRTTKYEDTKYECTPEEYEIARQNHIKSMSKSVICINTGVEFNSISSASRETGIIVSSIADCCKNKTKSAGKDEKNMPLFWCYKNDYYDGIFEDKMEKYNKNFKSNKVICLNTKEEFMLDKLWRTDFSEQGVRKCCSGKQYYSGKTDDGECLFWCYKDDYYDGILDEKIRLYQEHMAEISKIQSDNARNQRKRITSKQIPHKRRPCL